MRWNLRVIPSVGSGMSVAPCTSPLDWQLVTLFSFLFHGPSVIQSVRGTHITLQARRESEGGRHAGGWGHSKPHSDSSGPTTDFGEMRDWHERLTDVLRCCYIRESFTPAKQNATIPFHQHFKHRPKHDFWTSFFCSYLLTFVIVMSTLGTKTFLNNNLV